MIRVWCGYMDVIWCYLNVMWYEGNVTCCHSDVSCDKGVTWWCGLDVVWYERDVYKSDVAWYGCDMVLIWVWCAWFGRGIVWCECDAIWKWCDMIWMWYVRCVWYGLDMGVTGMIWMWCDISWCECDVIWPILHFVWYGASMDERKCTCREIQTKTFCEWMCENKRFQEAVWWCFKLSITFSWV